MTDSANAVRNEFGTPDRWFVLCLVSGNYFTLYLHRSLINYLQPPLKAELGLSDFQLGLLLWGFLLPYALSQIAVGYLGDRFSRRTVLLVSLLSSTLALAAMGLVNNFSQLLTLRVLLAVTQSASVPAIAGIMADCFSPRSRSNAVSVYLIAMPLSTVAAGWLGGRVADFLGWRVSMFLFGGFGVMFFLLLLSLLREPERTERQSNVGLSNEGGSLFKTLAAVLTMPSFLLLAAAYVLAANVLQLTLFWLPRHFYELFEMNLEGAGRMATLWTQSGTVLGLFAGGLWADRLAQRFKSGRFLVQITGLLICAPALAVMGTSHDPVWLCATMFVFGVAANFYFSNLWTSTFEVVDPAARSTAIGLLNVASGVLGAWVTPLVGFLRDRGTIGDLGLVFEATAVATLVSAGILALIVVTCLQRDYRGPLK